MSAEHDAFSLGERDGSAAGVAGGDGPPEPDPILLAADPVGMEEYRKGAQIGFEKDLRRREELRARAQDQIEKGSLDRE